jgi:hypothetical protein
MATISLGAHREQPSHPAAETIAGVRPVHQVQLVGHQSVFPQNDRPLPSGMASANAS